jgi:hypothetical protein
MESLEWQRSEQLSGWNENPRRKALEVGEREEMALQFSQDQADKQDADYASCSGRASYPEKEERRAAGHRAEHAGDNEEEKNVPPLRNLPAERESRFRAQTGLHRRHTGGREGGRENACGGRAGDGRTLSYPMEMSAPSLSKVMSMSIRTGSCHARMDSGDYAQPPLACMK